MLTPAQGITYNKFEAPNDWPKIDKTFDYKIENGKLLSGNEHIYLNGPVTYTKVGSPTIKDNIISGFTNSNYITVLPPTVTSSLDIVIKYKLTQRTSFRSDLLQTTIAYGIVIRESADQESFLVYFNDGSSWSGAYLTGVPVVLNTDSYIKLSWSGSSVVMSYSYDNVTWTQGATISKPIAPSWGDGLLCFGGTSRENTPLTYGSIDLSETYIKVNDRLWFYGKNYTTKNIVAVPAGLEYNNTTTPSIGWVNTNTDRVKGPVDYTVVGSPTIVDGVVSGFSANDGIRISNFPALTSNWEFVIHATAGSEQGQHRAIILPGIYLREIADTWNLYFANGSDTWAGNVTNYPYIKIMKTNSTAAVYNSADGTNYSLVSDNLNTGDSLTDAATINLGNNSLPWDGSIDLNNTYITVNGQPWFGNCPSEFQKFTQAPEGTMIGKDDTHSLAVETYQDKGIVDYTVVGSPTIVDGVASGFSTTDYLETSSSFTLSPTTKATFHLEYNTDEIPEPTGGLSIFNINNFNIFGMYRVVGNGWFYWNSSIFGDMYKDPNDNYKFAQANTKYKVDISFVGDGTASIDIYNASNVLQIHKEGTVTTTETGVINISKLTYNDKKIKNIDLNETYIKVNGQYWFHPYPNSYPKLVGPVNYTVVGNPTITNGILTNTYWAWNGGNNNRYLQTNASWPENVLSFEFVLKVKGKTEATTGWYPLLSNSVTSGAQNVHTLDIYSVTGISNLPLRYSPNFSGSNSEILFSQQIVPVNSWIWIKITHSEDNYSLYKSTDGETYTLVQSVTSELRPVAGNPIFYGASCLDGGKTLSMEIDLNETYINVNSNLWFGKEDWKPSTYIDNAIYLLGSHNTDYSSYKELDFTPTISDNSTYDLWIDNQKVVENRSQGTHIDWEQLDLSTGYDITTPSALKAHTIKIEPTDNSKQITGYQSNAEYTVDNGKLVWADPDIYLQATGTQYIYTGVTCADDIGFETEVQVDQYNVTERGLFATTKTSPSMYYVLQAHNGNLKLYMGDAPSGYLFNDSSVTGFHVLSYNKQGDKKMYKDGSFLNTVTHTITSFEYPFYLFARDVDNSLKANSAGYFTCKYFKIYQAGVLVRHLVPVPQGLVIGSYTVPSNGMFDIVTQQFYANAGTGTFTIGKNN